MEGYIRIVSLCYKLNVPFLFLHFKAMKLQQKLFVNNIVCISCILYLKNVKAQEKLPIPGNIWHKK